MISQTAEYALRAIVDLAYHAGESRTTRQIAKATKVPTGYLAKILQDLSRHRLVRSQRGLHGGFTLNGNPAVLTVYDVLKAVDPMRRIHSCPLGLAAHAHKLCPLHQELDDAMSRAMHALSTIVAATGVIQPYNPVAGEALSVANLAVLKAMSR